MNYSYLVKEFAIISGTYFLGEILVEILHLPLPGSVLGMIILTILILTNTIKIEEVESAAALLLDNMALFFVPPGVGLMLYFNIISTQSAAIMLTILFSTFIVIGLTGKTVDIIINKYKKE